MNCSHFGKALFDSQEPIHLNEVLTLAKYCCVDSIPISLGLMLLKPLYYQIYSCAVHVVGAVNGSLNNMKWVILFFITSRILPVIPRILDWVLNSEPARILEILSIMGSYIMTSLSDLAIWHASVLYSAGQCL